MSGGDSGVDLPGYAGRGVAFGGSVASFWARDADIPAWVCPARKHGIPLSDVRHDAGVGSGGSRKPVGSVSSEPCRSDFGSWLYVGLIWRGGHSGRRKGFLSAISLPCNRDALADTMAVCGGGIDCVGVGVERAVGLFSSAARIAAIEALVGRLLHYFGEAMKVRCWSKGRLVGVLTLLALSSGLCGCGALSYLAHKLVPAGKGKWVAAESEALNEGKKLLILVYANQAIQYQHEQLARYNTASMIAEHMQSKLKVDVVDPATVEQFQASDLDWTDRHPSQIARERYRADLVLYIELREFTTAAEESGELLRGRMEGTCSLYTVSESVADPVELLWERKVESVYPPDMPVVADIGAVDRIRYDTINLFAEHLVKYFYGHYEPY